MPPEVFLLSTLKLIVILTIGHTFLKHLLMNHLLTFIKSFLFIECKQCLPKKYEIPYKIFLGRAKCNM